MSKTQLLSVTKNLYIARKDTQLFDTKLLLYTVQIQGQVTPKTRNRKFSCSFIFGDTSHIPTIQSMKSK